MTRSKEIDKVRWRAMEFEGEYFEDMTLFDESFAPLFCNIEWFSISNEVSIERVSFKLLLDDTGDFGYFSPKDNEIAIVPDTSPEGGFSIADEKLLHEMIHYYEHGLDEINSALHEYFVIHLWRKLSQAIPDLDLIIISSLELETHRNLEAEGGRHDVLFLLKSFDLDQRTGNPLGTVFGYGMADDIEAMRDNRTK